MRTRNLRSAGRSCRALLGYGALFMLGGTYCAAAETAAEGVLEEVIVTAQKREQSVQDVPISISAITQDSLQANRVANVIDLSALAPNMTVRPATGGVGLPSFSMRGVVSYGSVPGSDKSISLYLDGVYVGSTIGSAFDLPEVQRIEVLRGPQGTLFGRNATAGAISVVTPNPTGEFSVRQDVSYGNYDYIRAKTRVEFPQWGPLSALISYVHEARNGDINNLGAGQVWDRSGPGTHQGVAASPQTLGDKDADSVFAALRFQPAGNVDIIDKFDFAQDHNTPQGTALIAVSPDALGPGFAPFLNAIFNSNTLRLAGAHRPDFVNNSWATPGYQRNLGNSLTATWQIADHLSLKNIGAYRNSYVYANDQISGAGGLQVTAPVAAVLAAFSGLPPGSLDGLIGSPFVLSDSQAASSAKQWSDELQLNYDSKYVTVTAGALYLWLKTVSGNTLATNITSFAPVPGGRVALAPFNPFNISYKTTNSTAGYSQAEFHITPQVDVVAGARVTKDRKGGTDYVNGVPFQLPYDKTKLTYSLGVDYKPKEDWLVYGKYSTGFVSGGIVGSIPYEPETVESWEAGLKADLLDKRMRLSFAAFTALYEHLQTTNQGINIGHPELSIVIVDQGNERAEGFESELTVAPMSGLTFNAGLGYTNSDFTSVNPILGTTSTFLPTLRPKWTSNLSGQYETIPVWGDARLVFRADAAWHSRILQYAYVPVPAGYGAIYDTPQSWVVNARVALKDIKMLRADAEVALWVRNLTDNSEVQFPVAFGNPPFLASSTYQAARTYGIDLNVRF
ncbi:MAG TPA: TonB-dependent receptor [Steroidobacteraceae bacterium]|nr:TonB-dependent receptor [Steroidobacteraceae bacterium]